MAEQSNQRVLSAVTWEIIEGPQGDLIGVQVVYDEYVPSCPVEIAAAILNGEAITPHHDAALKLLQRIIDDDVVDGALSDLYEHGCSDNHPHVILLERLKKEIEEVLA